jgi:hypothetical protein
MSLGRALLAWARIRWWRLVLSVASWDTVLLGREWPYYIDARWRLHLAQADLKHALEGE